MSARPAGVGEMAGEQTRRGAVDTRTVVPVHVTKYTTLLACMSVDGGPEGCCGCFNGYWCDWEGGFISFECNECGRQPFVASAAEVRALLMDATDAPAE